MKNFAERYPELRRKQIEKDYHIKITNTMDKSPQAKALNKVKEEPLNAWGQDAKTAKGVRKALRQEKKMKSFNKHSVERFNKGY